MIQKFEFKGLDMKGAYEITPFYATDERGGFIKAVSYTHLTLPTKLEV